MRKITVTDEWLYQYMPVVDEALIRKLEENTDYEYRFSRKFEKRMKKLMRQEAHPRRSAFQRLLKEAAVLFICVISLVFVMAMSAQAYRIKFFETVKSIWEDSILYSYFTGKNQGAIQYNEPKYIPEGYQETDRTESDQLLSVIYINGEQEMITWDQMLVQDGGAFVADNEYDEWIMKETNGYTVMAYMYDDGFIMAYCEHEKYVYVLTADNLSFDEVYSMFDSITIN